MDADVLIVGAGPAGSHLAHRLANAGWRCVLIDRAVFPRDKVCGGGVSLKAARLLGGLPHHLSRRSISGVVFSHRNRWHVTVDLARPAGYTVTRRELDHWLLQRAQAAGARVMMPVRYLGHRLSKRGVVVRTDAGTLETRLLVGADGAGSRVRKALVGHGRRDGRPGVEVLIPETGPSWLQRRALFDLGAVRGGYGWIFPKGDHLNAGVFAGVGPGVRRGDLEGFLRCYGLSQGRAETLGYAIPLEGVDGAVEGPRVWLVGDAAGLAEPMLGEGIYHALLSAEVAAACLREGLPAPGVYRRALRRVLGRELWAARWLGRGVFAASRVIVRRFARREGFSRRFTALMTGDCDFGRCLWGTLLTLPWHALAPPRHTLGGSLTLG